MRQDTRAKTGDLADTTDCRADEARHIADLLSIDTRAVVDDCLPRFDRSSLTHRRPPDGSQEHQVLLDYVCDQVGCLGTHDGVDQLPYATATGQ